MLLSNIGGPLRGILRGHSLRVASTILLRRGLGVTKLTLPVIGLLHKLTVLLLRRLLTIKLVLQLVEQLFGCAVHNFLPLLLGHNLGIYTHLLHCWNLARSFLAPSCLLVRWIGYLLRLLLMGWVINWHLVGCDMARLICLSLLGTVNNFLHLLLFLLRLLMLLGEDLCLVADIDRHGLQLVHFLAIAVEQLRGWLVVTLDTRVV